ncbi:MAG: hypothetical protein R2853_11695 [Thermomicrobiales bacterium]
MINRIGRWVRYGRVLLCGMLLVAGSSATAVAQEGATPAAQGTPATAWDIPAPEACAVEPRAFPLFPAGVGQREPATPQPLEATPAPAFVAPDGDPVTPDLEASVLATVRESIACRNANQMLRAYALFTEPMIVSLFGGPATVDPEIRALIQQGDELGPLPRRQRVALLQVSQIAHRPDGRIGAIVTTGTVDRVFQDYLVFTYDAASSRWLIDEAVLLASEPMP